MQHVLFSHNITCTFLRIINVTQYLQREALRDKVICETPKDYWASKEAVHYKSIRQKLWKDNVLHEINLNIIKVKNYCDLTKATKSKYIKVQLLWNTLAGELRSEHTMPEVSVVIMRRLGEVFEVFIWSSLVFSSRFFFSFKLFCVLFGCFIVN